MALRWDDLLAWLVVVVEGALIRLWSINRWLRYTGFRLTIGETPDPEGVRPFTMIGFTFWGWSFLRGESA